MKNKKTTRGRVIAGYIIFGIIYLLGLLIQIIVHWSLVTFETDLSGILFTLTTPLEGADSSTVVTIFKTCVPKALLWFAPYLMLVALDVWLRNTAPFTLYVFKKPIRTSVKKLLRTAVAVLCSATLVCSLAYTVSEYDVGAYISNKFKETKIYQQYYVDPRQVDITAQDGSTKNLIFIYLESMETAYASVEEGGNQQVNLIPNLTAVARNNVSFSNSEALGGFRSFTGTTFTLSALFSTNAGVPFAFPVGGNSMNEYSEFATGIVSLGDILESKGYAQEFLCGSDANYAGRKNFFEQHGGYEVFDLYTARQTGYIPEDYYVWWGFEDKYLYRIAKDEITRLATGGKPFNFTMLTVDTHFPDGYICELCGSDYQLVAENVLSCADRQIKEFLDWCSQQDFYEDTTIVLIGDHPRMDTVLVENLEYLDRTVYNCFINADVGDKQPTLTNRDFSSMDIMPTTLSAMGFDIEGERLGLGTNLFSDKPTLSEELGADYLQEEFGKSSSYYVKQFK